MKERFSTVLLAMAAGALVPTSWAVISCGGGGVSSSSSSSGCTAPETPRGSKCVDESTDPKNCGSCGHDCQGGTCQGSMCQPVVLASPQNRPQGIAVDATSVYWANASTAPNFADGAVMKVGLDGGTPTALASGQSSPHFIAVDTTSVYWANDGDGTLMKVGLGDAGILPPTVLASAGALAATGIAVDATSLYWLSLGGTVMKVGLGGGIPTQLASGLSKPLGIAVDVTHVYWADNGNGMVMKVGLGGGTPSVLASGQLGAYRIAVDAMSVYFLFYDLQWRLRRLGMEGGARRRHSHAARWGRPGGYRGGRPVSTGQSPLAG